MMPEHKTADDKKELHAKHPIQAKLPPIAGNKSAIKKFLIDEIRNMRYTYYHEYGNKS